MTLTGALWIFGFLVTVFFFTILDRYLKYYFQVKLLKKKDEYKDGGKDS